MFHLNSSWEWKALSMLKGKPPINNLINLFLRFLIHNKEFIAVITIYILGEQEARNIFFFFLFAIALSMQAYYLLLHSSTGLKCARM